MKIDDYAKDRGPEEVSLLCSFYHESLRTWIKTIIRYFKSYGFDIRCACSQKVLEGNCEYGLHSYQIKKLVAQRIMVKTTSRSDRPGPPSFV